MNLKLLTLTLFTGILASAQGFAADHSNTSSDEDSKPALNKRCFVGTGAGCPSCPDINLLPRKAPPGRLRTEKDRCDSTVPFCGDDGRVYTYNVHYSAIGSINDSGPMISIPNLTDENGDRICPAGYVYRVLKAK